MYLSYTCCVCITKFNLCRSWFQDLVHMKKHKTRLGLDQVSTHAFFLFFITLCLQPLPLDNSFVKIRTSPLSSGGKDMADEPKHI